MQCPVKIEDVIHGTVLFEDVASVEKTDTGKITCVMDSPDLKSTWTIMEKGSVLKNHGDLTTTLILKEDGTGKALIDSPFGRLESVLENVQICKHDAQTELKYSLGEESYHFILSIQKDGKTQ